MEFGPVHCVQQDPNDILVPLIYLVGGLHAFIALAASWRLGLRAAHRQDGVFPSLPLCGPGTATSGPRAADVVTQQDTGSSESTSRARGAALAPP